MATVRQSFGMVRLLTSKVNLNDIVQNVLDAMPMLKKPQKIFILLLLSALVVFQGKATFRKIPENSGQVLILDAY